LNHAIREPLFADLVFNEEGQPTEVVYVGGVPHYAVPDGNFMRHVEAEHVDRQIVETMKERIMPMRDAIVEALIPMLGEENLFTRPAIEQAIENMDRILEPGAVNMDELRTALWMTKFRVTVDVHGDVLRVEIPGFEGGEYD